MSGGELLAAAAIAGVAYILRDGKFVPIPGSGQIKMPFDVEFRPYLFRTSIPAGTKKTLFTIDTRPDYKTVIRLFGQNWFTNSKWRLIQSGDVDMEWQHQLSYLFSPMSFNQPVDKSCSLEIENNDANAHDYNLAIWIEGPTTKISGLTDGLIDSTSMSITTAPVVQPIFTLDGVAVPPPAAGTNVIAWYAPFNCTVTNVRGYRVGGTGATINARKNGASNHLATALSLTSADAWMNGGAVQNVSYATGDKLEIMFVTLTGTPTQIGIQIDFVKA